MYDEEYLHSLPHGEERLNYMKKCISEADKEKNISLMLELRYRYIEESVFHDDCFKAIIIFPEFMKLFEENPGEFDNYYFMIAFKWIIQDSNQYYQVSVEQLDSYFERFKEYINKFGYSLRTYYLKIAQAYVDIDSKKAFEAFKLFENYERTRLSDCKACEMNAKVEHEVKFGSEEKAVAMLNNMLDKNMKCSEVPQGAYGEFVDAFTKRGIYDEAEHYANVLMPMVKGEEINFMKEVSSVLILKSKTDINYAIDLFSRCAGKFSGVKNPYLKFHFAKASYLLFSEIAKTDTNEVYLRLPSDFEKHSADGNYSVAEMRDFFYNTAKDIAEKFDARNGNDFFAQELAYKYPDSPEKKIVLFPHGAVEPLPPEIGILFKDEEDMPSPEEFVPKAEELFGYRNSQLQMVKDSPVLFYSAESDEGAVRYRIIYTEKFDISSFKKDAGLAEDIDEQLEEYKGMVVIMPDVINSDRFQEVYNTLRFAEMLDKGGSPAVLLLSIERIMPKSWLSMTVKSKTPPTTENCIGLRIFHSAFEEEKYDIVSYGLSVFGSRELIVTSAGEEDIGYCAGILNKLCEDIMVQRLPDEGVSMGSGIVYDDRAYVRFTWEKVLVPDNDVPFAEPILYFSASDQANKKGYRLPELTDEQLSKTRTRKHGTIIDYDEQRAKELFPYALEYFRNNTCKLAVGVNMTALDEDGDEIESFAYAELDESGSRGEIFSIGDDVANIKIGDDIDIEPENVFNFLISINDEEYGADELYMLIDF